jgi:hypothetical protein
MNRMTAENMVIHYRLMKALYAKETPFVELEQIWALVEYVERELMLGGSK